MRDRRARRRKKKGISGVKAPGPVRKLASSDLQELVQSVNDILAEEKGSVIIDLLGRTVAGPADGPLVITGSSNGGDQRTVTLQNGVLQVTDSFALLVQNAAVVMRDLSLLGRKLQTSPECPGVLEAEGPGAALVMQAVQVEGGQEDALLISHGASVQLRECSFCNASENTVKVSGEGSSLEAWRTRFQDSNGMVLAVSDGARAVLHECDVSGSAERSGVFVKGGGSALEAHRSRFHDNAQLGVLLWEGGAAELYHCDLFGSRTLHGMQVRFEGSQAYCKSCRFFNNMWSGLWVNQGSRAVLEDCSFHGNQRTALEVRKPSSAVEATRCKIAGAVETFDGGKFISKPAC